ncbi:MAG: hypothetical protein J6568_03770 [Snodgrassella sp.]|nr:hypothetical protein [Snodgrassella sp.]
MELMYSKVTPSDFAQLMNVLPVISTPLFTRIVMDNHDIQSDNEGNKSLFRHSTNCHINT